MTKPFILFLLLICSSCLLRDEANNNTVMWVNEEPVHLDEFNHWMRLLRTNVHNQFNREVGLEDFEFCWNQTYGNHIPADWLKKATINRVKLVKIQQIEAKKLGVISTVCYNKWMHDMDKENQLRNKRVSMGKPVFGSVEFNSRTYFDYKFDQMVYDLKEKLELSGMANKHIYSDSISGFEEMTLKDSYYPLWVERMGEEAEVRINHTVLESIVVR